MDVGHVASPAGTRVTSIVLAFTLVAGTIVFLRLFTRLVLTRVAGFEDACIVLAMALSISLTVMTSDQVMHGLGRHISKLSADERFTFLKAFWSSLWIHSLALTITKTSILLQYLRIFTVRRFQMACFLVLGVVVAYGAWAVFGNIFLCSPIASFWDHSIKDGSCMDRSVIWFTNAGINIGQDVVILLLPMPLIQTLQIPKDQKRGLVIMLALGASISIVSVIRLWSLDDVVKSDDLPFDGPAYAILSAVEVNVAITCACLPAMRPLLALTMPKYFSAAAHYTNVPGTLDLGLPSTHKHRQKLSNSTRSATSRTHTAGTNTPRTDTPQAPRPTLLRNSSGHFIIHSSSSSSSRPSTPVQITTPTPRQIIQFHHSRSDSNISIDIAAAEARADKLGAEDRPHSLRCPMRLSLQSIGPGFFTIKTSDGPEKRMSGAGLWPSDTVAGSRRDKHLPLTPFPVGAAA